MLISWTFNYKNIARGGGKQKCCQNAYRIRCCQELSSKASVLTKVLTRVVVKCSCVVSSCCPRCRVDGYGNNDYEAADDEHILYIYYIL
jgi:hypothetical protein